MSRSFVPALVLALFAVPTAAAAQGGPYCPANLAVAPGTCICPPGLVFRMHTTAANTCGVDGQCVCPSGTWNGHSCGGVSGIAAATTTASTTASTTPTQTATTTPTQSATTTTVSPNFAIGTTTIATRTTTTIDNGTTSCAVNGCPMGQVCAANACVFSGPMRYTLTWSPSADLDLQVVAQGGVTVDAQHRQGGGGVLDRDDRTGAGPENVFWSDPPEPGHYSLCVAAWGVAQPVNFEVQIALPDGSSQTVRGTRTAPLSSRCVHGGPTNVATITIPISGAPVITPPTVPLPNMPALAVASTVSSNSLPPISSAPNQPTSAFPGQPTPARPQPGTGTTTQVVVVPNAAQRPMSFDVRQTAGRSQPARVTELRFLAWNRQPFAARLEGTTFVIAPNGDFSQARRDSSIQFISWDGQRSSAQVNGTSWTVHPTTANDQARFEPVLPFVQWDGQRATAQITP